MASRPASRVLNRGPNATRRDCIVRREIPGALWFGLVALALIVVVQFLLGMGQGNVPLLIGAACSLVLLFGLYHGYRWAFVMTLLLGMLGILTTLVRNPLIGLGTIVINGFVLVPIWLAKDYFWAPRWAARDGRPKFCGRCGQDLAGIGGRFCPNCGNEVAAGGGTE